MSCHVLSRAFCRSILMNPPSRLVFCGEVANVVTVWPETGVICVVQLVNCGVVS
jgi:hypothetical protein